ncbi:hypothetical protein, partial [Klebsiella quasipneumoniae]
MTDSRLGHGPQVQPRFALNPLTAGVLTALVALLAPSAWAEDVQFNDAFLPEDSRSLDLTRYQKGNPVLPGNY